MAAKISPKTTTFKPEMTEEEEVSAANFLVWMSGATLEKVDAVKVENTRRKVVIFGRENEELLSASKTISIDGSILPRYPPIPFLVGKIDLTACSVPFEKQLTPTDVKEGANRLFLNKDEVIKSILPLLDNRHEDLLQGISVTTYDPKGKKWKMKFKSWSDEKYYVLNGGWKEFFTGNNLMEYRHWVTVWMFRHSRTRKLCFALTWKLMPTDGPCPKPKPQKRIKMEDEKLSKNQERRI